jgi:protein gp37
MSFDSSIEWTQRTWNFLIGCTKKSKGCMHCYAIRVAWRLMHNPNPKITARYAGTVARDSKGQLNWTGRINFDEEVLKHPLSWREPSMIFVNSLSDPFHKNVKQSWRDRMCAVMALCAHHTFQLLTKEPETALAYFTDPETPDRIGDASFNDHEVMMTSDPACPSEDFVSLQWPLPNVWLGFSAEDQETFDRRWRYMKPLAEAGWTVFASLEPLLGSIILPDDFLAFGARVQVIVGGESGPDARPMHPDWVRALRWQCVAHCVSFFFKQWGEWLPVAMPRLDARVGETLLIHLDGKTEAATWTDVIDAREEVWAVQRVGKKTAGRVLDGRTWDEFPIID